MSNSPDVAKLDRETVGFEDVEVRENRQYQFVSDGATGACRKYGVKRISLRAHDNEQVI